MPNNEAMHHTLRILNGLGQGNIGLEPRIAAGEDVTSESVQMFGEALMGDELFARVDAVVPHKCVDGRPRQNGQASLGPDAAGGTESLVIGMALVDGSDAKASDDTRILFSTLISRGFVVGGHDAAGAHGGSGCGACDKLGDVLAFISKRGDDIRDILAALDVLIDDTTHQTLKQHASELAASNYAEGGPNIIAAMKAAGGEVETLAGDHKELVVVINTRAGTTLDRAAVASKFGQAYQAFNVDAWALKASADMLAEGDAARAQQLYSAMLYYNIAVAAVLSHGSLRIVTR